MKIAIATIVTATFLVSACETEIDGTPGGSGEGAGGCSAGFDGVDDGLVVDAGGIALADEFSLSVFLHPEPLEDDATAFVAGLHLDGSSNGFYLALARESGTTRAKFIVFPGDSTCAPRADLPEGSVHLLGTYSEGTARLFIQGALAASESCGPPAIESSARFTIGRSESNVFPFAGLIDDVAYYRRAHTEAFDAATLGCTDASFRVDFEAAEGEPPTRMVDACGASSGAALGVGEVDTEPVVSCP